MISRGALHGCGGVMWETVRGELSVRAYLIFFSINVFGLYFNNYNNMHWMRTGPTRAYGFAASPVRGVLSLVLDSLVLDQF